MTPAALRAFLQENHRGVLATRKKDGGPQMSPIVFALSEQGEVLVSTRQPTAKARNVARSPEVALCVLNDGFFGEWAQVEGEATLVKMPQAMELLRYVYKAVAGEHPDWDEFEREMVAQERLVIKFRPRALDEG